MVDMKENSIIYDKVAEEMKDLQAEYKSLKEAEDKIIAQGGAVPKDDKRKKIEKVANIAGSIFHNFYLT